MPDAKLPWFLVSKNGAKYRANVVLKVSVDTRHGIDKI